MFNGKEPVHIRPWGDDPNISLAALSVNDPKGSVKFGLYLRICVKPPFSPKTCTPYAIGPLPYGSVSEGGTIVIASSDPPPVVSPTLSGNQGCAGGGANGLPAPSSNPNAPISQQNLKRYLDRIAAGESAGGTNLGPNYLGAYGKYQFIPSTRAAILAKYGYDAWNPAQWDNAAISLIKDVGGQGLLDTIASGNFTGADSALNRTWTSLPGGAEQSPLWRDPANLVAYGPVSGTQVAGTAQSTTQNGTQNSQQTQGTLIASATGSVCGTPIPCPPGQKCILLNPNPKGIIPSYGGMYGAPRPGRIHSGVDLQSPKAAQNWQQGPGENIKAAADGTVSEHVPVGGRCGGIVAISHPGFNLETRYVHMVQTFVAKGQTVTRGQDIGVEGNETPQGCGSTGAHLHYEIYASGGSTDPTKIQHEPPLPTSPGV
jgi:murein DD-endopeptidase MepM/ murein hydrolase activator NlpD